MWVKGRKEVKHTAMCVPMQLSCTFCNVPQNLKCNKKLRNKIKNKTKKKKVIQWMKGGRDIVFLEHAPEKCENSNKTNSNLTICSTALGNSERLTFETHPIRHVPKMEH